MRSHQRKRILIIGGVVGAFSIAPYVAGVLWRASRVTAESAQELQVSSEIRFTSARLDRPPTRNFEWFSAPAVCSDAVSFSGPIVPVRPCRTGERIVVDGRGAGHGIGLCQRGANTMAVSGPDHRRILNYYYPNTLIGFVNN